MMIKPNPTLLVLLNLLIAFGLMGVVLSWGLLVLAPDDGYGAGKMGAGMLLAPCCLCSIVALLAPGLLLLISARTHRILVLNASLPFIAAAVFILYFSGRLSISFHGLVVFSLLLLVLVVITAAAGMVSLQRQTQSEPQT